MRRKCLFSVPVVIVALAFLFVADVSTVSAQEGAAASGRVEISSGSYTSTVKRKPRPVAKRTAPKAVVAPKKTAAAYAAEGDRFYDQKDYDSALVAYQNAVKLNPKLIVPLYRIGWIYNDFQEYAKALLSLNQALNLDSNQAVIYLEKGFAHRHLDQTSEALAALKKCLELDPKSDIAHYYLGEMYNDMKMYNEAVASLNQAIYYRPDYANAYEELGVAQRRLGRNSEAVAAFNKSIQLDPSDSGAYMGLGDVYYYGTKEYQKAINAYLKGLQYDSDNYIAAYNIGWSYNELENYNEALTWLNKVISLKPAYAEAYREMGYANFKLKKDTPAIAAYQKALQLDPSLTSAQFGIADVYYEDLKNYQLAADNYKRGLARSPDNALALYRLGFSYNDSGRFEEAIVPLARARQLKPEWAGVHLEIGYAFLKLKRYSDSITALKQTIALNRDSQPGHLYLGQAYVYANLKDAAMGEYRELKRLKSEEYAQQLLDLIKP
jgi:tetratricopeptide (TPR) repeat protein